MTKVRQQLLRYALALLFVAGGQYAVANHGHANRDAGHQQAAEDSATVATVYVKQWEELKGHRGQLHSAYPVKLKVKGNSLRISSQHSQLLPIYRQDGQLYLSLQLTPGVNWLNGLPSGRYRINNRTICII